MMRGSVLLQSLQTGGTGAGEYAQLKRWEFQQVAQFPPSDQGIYAPQLWVGVWGEALFTRKSKCLMLILLFSSSRKVSN